MKKVVLIVLAVLIVLGAAVGGLFFLLKFDRKSLPDIRDTPIPLTLDLSSAPTESSAQQSPVSTKDATIRADSETAMLFGVQYPAEVFRSKETYLSADNLETAVQRRTYYKNKNGDVIYISLIEKENMAVYNAEDRLVYFSGAEKPQTDYLTEPIHCFYHNGALACAELCFYDGDNNGVAYYNAAGELLCIRTEIVSATKKEGVQVSTVCYGSDFAEISEDAFRALLPQVDEADFLFINWG